MTGDPFDTYNLIMHFEWDETKRETNIEKHGIDFIDAIAVFFDLHALERFW